MFDIRLIGTPGQPDFTATINGKPYHECDGETLRGAATQLMLVCQYPGEEVMGSVFAAQAKIADAGGTAMFPGVYRDGKRMKARVVELANTMGGSNEVWEIHDGTKRDGSPNIFHAPINRNWKQAAKNYDDMPEFAPARAVLHVLPVTGMPVCKVVRTGCEWGTDAKPICTLATSAMTQRRTTMRQRQRSGRTYGGR